MKRVAFVATLVLLSTVIFLLFFSNEKIEILPSTIDNRERNTLSINKTTIEIEIVDTPDARQRGLSGRPLLLENQGMFFIFPEDDFYGIWMKDMLFPIDILWINNELVIVDIKEGALPESFPDVFSPRERSRYVLEVNSDFVKEHEIKIGNTIQFE